MTLQFSLNSDGLERFEQKLEGVDMDDVKEEGVRRAAEEMASKVRDNVSSSPGIDAPSHLNSPYYEGGVGDSDYQSDGPSMVQGAAWEVNPVSKGVYNVSPHPSVRKRAIYLEYGTGPTITPDGNKPMKFFSEGVPAYSWAVSGVQAQGFWRGAIRYMEANDRLEHHLDEVLDEELEENGL